MPTWTTFPATLPTFCAALVILLTVLLFLQLSTAKVIAKTSNKDRNSFMFACWNWMFSEGRVVFLWYNCRILRIFVPFWIFYKLIIRIETHFILITMFRKFMAIEILGFLFKSKLDCYFQNSTFHFFTIYLIYPNDKSRQPWIVWILTKVLVWSIKCCLLQYNECIYKFYMQSKRIVKRICW